MYGSIFPTVSTQNSKAANPVARTAASPPQNPGGRRRLPEPIIFHILLNQYISLDLLTIPGAFPVSSLKVYKIQIQSKFYASWKPEKEIHPPFFHAASCLYAKVFLIEH